MDDSKIIELFWKRDESAIQETENQYGSYCHSIAFRITNCQEDADECVSDTWLRAWNLMPDKRPAVLSVFLGGITRQLALDRFKAGRRKKRGGGEAPLALDELAECVSGGETPPEKAEAGLLSRK